ncbi:MAG: hypothetical protein Q9222_000178 [Ikaeria aurantiellina]
MTTNLTGTQRVPKPPNHLNTHVFPRFSLLSATDGYSSKCDAEPAFKKQKLDNGRDPITASPGSQTPLTSLSLGHDDGSQHPDDAKTNVTTVLNKSFVRNEKPPPTASLSHPLRPFHGQQKVRKRNQKLPRPRRSLDVEGVQTRPFVLRPPSSAPRYPFSSKRNKRSSLDTPERSSPLNGEDAADFAPWSGNSMEDVLSDSTTKQGFQDKVQVSQNESSSAKLSVWNSLKHKPGLQVMSSLFTLILEKREIHGTIIVGSTFKPPPRVTLTDSKRETWLRDLANPNIPLRRLSRTIPHGIRGRALLDHALAKKIPIARTLWLAQCVGANEIRAFKRKGASGAFAVGGDMKWIREWTANVEQYLDAIIKTCGCEGWQEKLAYCLKLAAHLLAESLLDREHYFDWLLTAIAGCQLDTLPVYLTIIRSHLDELGQSRRFGRRLVKALLDQLYEIEHHSMQPLYTIVGLEVAAIIKILLILSPSSFLLLDQWSKYSPMLRAAVGPGEPVVHSQYEKLHRRNIRLQGMASSETTPTLESPQVLLDVLDSVSPGVGVSDIAHDMFAVSSDPSLLVHTCLRWCSSMYRSGHGRMYAAARLLRKWSRMGIDVETCILDFIAADGRVRNLEQMQLYRVIGELIRSRHFSVGRYLHWLIANGMPDTSNLSGKKSSCGLGLIHHIPLDGLPLHVIHLRQNLLRLLSISGDDETRQFAQNEGFINAQLGIAKKDFAMPSDMGHQPISHCSKHLTIKLDIGYRIRKKISSLSARLYPIQEPSLKVFDRCPPSPLRPIVNVGQLQALLGILEDAEDFTSMGQVLTQCPMAQDAQLLTVAARTLCHYLDIFLAIGGADTLCAHFWQQRSKVVTGSESVSLIETLLDLGRALTNHPGMIRELQDDLRKHESKISVTACSPISEHMAEAIQINEPGTDGPCTDDIEQLLSSGTSIDKRLLSKLFDAIWKRFELTWNGSIQPSLVAASLLSRLCSFDSIAITQMMFVEIDKALLSHQRPKLMRIWLSLVCSQAIPLDKLLNQFSWFLRAAKDPAAVGQLVVEAAECLVASRPKADASIQYLYYRFYYQQQQLLSSFSPDVVMIIHRLLECALNDGENPTEAARRLLRGNDFQTFLRTYPSRSPRHFEWFEEAFAPIVAANGVAQILEDLIIPLRDGERRNPSYVKHALTASLASEQEQDRSCNRVTMLLRKADSFSLPLYRLYLRAMMTDMSKLDEDASHVLTSVIQDLVSTTTPERLRLWASLLSGLPPEQRQSIRNKSEAEFLALVSQPTQSRMEDVPKHLRYLLSVTQEVHTIVHTSSSATRILSEIHRRLSDLIATLPSLLHRFNNKAGPEAAITPIDRLNYSMLDALLYFLHAHQSAFTTPDVSEGTIAPLIVRLSLLHVKPFPTSFAYLAELTYDFLVVICDDLSPAILSTCMHTLHKDHHLMNPRLDFLFACPSAPEINWLQVSRDAGSSRKSSLQAFPIRKWETMPDATPLMTENDTSISLTLFGARKAVL